MKKLIIPFYLLLCVSVVYAGSFGVHFYGANSNFPPSTTSTTVCNTLKDSEENNFLPNNIGYTAAWAATSFTAGSTYDACAISVNLWATSASASDINNVTAYIYSDNAGVPGTVLTDGTSSNSVLYTDIDAYTAYNSSGWHVFTFPNGGPTLTSTNVYWIVLRTNDAGGSAVIDSNNTEYVKWPLHNGEAAYDAVGSAGGVSWSVVYDEYQGLFRTYSGS